MAKGTIHYKGTIGLEAGGELVNPAIAFHTYGKLNPAKDNVVWVCHALTGSSDVLDWWGGLFGPDRQFDPADRYIVCVNIPGSCYGTVGPLSARPEGGAYLHQFPSITIRDIVKVLELVRQELQVDRIHTLIGASLGGQQALEWAIQQSALIDNLVLIATNAFHSPWGIAWNESQRQAIRLDPTWQNNSPEAGLEGMKVARGMALLSYRTAASYNNTQQEEVPVLSGFKASGYQQYQGEKLARRFNAFSYYVLSEAMDSHHIGRDRGNVPEVLATVTARTLVVTMEGDVLFPTTDQDALVENIPDATHVVIPTLFGHDGFLIETEAISHALQEWYAQQSYIPSTSSTVQTA